MSVFICLENVEDRWVSVVHVEIRGLMFERSIDSLLRFKRTCKAASGVGLMTRKILAQSVCFGTTLWPWEASTLAPLVCYTHQM